MHAAAVGDCTVLLYTCALQDPTADWEIAPSSPRAKADLFMLLAE